MNALEPEPGRGIADRRLAAVSFEVAGNMKKEPSTVETGGGKSRRVPAQERKQRLAEALRRNLAKRKDIKPANPGGKSAPG